MLGKAAAVEYWGKAVAEANDNRVAVKLGVPEDFKIY